ncbi:MAG TPA: FAD:protein FMN transferase [Solirubrobacterales bacterium]|nr:FAD:protein FMN transferase [Solirubrobacterales bacterium]HNN20043.1 FAD:protein FMN transferase [Solirubrobacterales bacterium]
MNDLATTLCFPALGGEVLIQAEGPGSDLAVEEARELVLDLHRRLTRFEPSSELCQLNRSSDRAVKASPLLLRFADEVHRAGSNSGGLVDATLLDQVEAAGYRDSINPDDPAGPGPSSPGLEPPARRWSWSDVTVDREKSTVIRPPGLRLDSGGIGKGLAADIVAERLEGFDSWAVECAGDLRFGGEGGAERRIDVKSPFPGRGVIADFTASAGAVATSGTTRRSWKTGSGDSHHLIDPRTGRPARTGLVQVTAVAPTAVEAEVRAKAALLSGPDRASEWLIDGGMFVTEEGEIRAWDFQRRPEVG